MNNLIHTLFLQHLQDCERTDTSLRSGVETVIKIAVGDDCEAASIGRSVLVTKQLTDGQLKHIDDFYKAACILCSSGSVSDLALAHMCVLHAWDRIKNHGETLTPSYAENFKALARDTWVWFESAIHPYD